MPHGRTDNGGSNDTGAWERAAEAADRRVAPARRSATRRSSTSIRKLDRGNDVNHLGTLGTGNHFIEVCLDESEHVWFMLHSGSRGVGNRIGTYFIELAKKDMRQHIEQPARQEPGLSSRKAPSTSTTTSRPWSWAQDFALYNRELMMEQWSPRCAIRRAAAVRS